MSTRWLGSLLAFTTTLLGYSSAQAPAPSVKTFLLESRATYPVNVPLFSSTSGECGRKENVFFQVARTSMSSTNVILSVPQSGGTPTPIPLPPDLGSAGEWRIAVDAGGMLFALYSEGDKHVLISFTASGNEVRRVTLRLPRYFLVHSFSINQAGDGMFFGGAPVSENAAVSRHRLQTIWLNRDGNIVLATGLGKSVDLSTERLDERIADGPGDTFLEASRSALTNFDEKGNVVRTFPLPPTPDGYFVSKVQYVDGRAAIEFSYRSGPPLGSVEDAQNSQDSQYGPLAQTWLLLDLNNGEAEGFFRMPSDFTGSALCYSGSHRFVYQSVVSGQPALIEAADRSF